MIIQDLSAKSFADKVRQGDLYFQVGPFVVCLQSIIPEVAEGLFLLYRDYTLSASDFADFHVSLASPSLLRHWYRPQVNFFHDGLTPFKPLPMQQALPMFEWGLNWCISSSAHQYLMLHSAVVEKNGQALILPAPPGSGKSTLCAGLVARGWRLLSDEMALVSIDPVEGEKVEVVPITRPISLKNRSIEVISQFAPEQLIGPATRDTLKGTVAHMRPPASSVRRMGEPAEARWIVFPKYREDSSTSLQLRSRARTYLEAAQQAFNFNILGMEGVTLLKSLVSQCECYDFEYSSLDEAASLFDSMAEALEVA